MSLDTVRLGRDIAALLAALLAWFQGKPFKVGQWRPALYLDGTASSTEYRIKG